MKKKLFIIFICLTVFSLTNAVSAAEAQADGIVSLSDRVDFPTMLTDGDTVNPATVSEGGTITVTCDGGIGALYIIFDKIPGEWTLKEPSGESSITCGENFFLHEFIDIASWLPSIPEELTLTFPNGATIAEIYIFTAGTIPDWVQRWEVPLERADLLMFSSHSDDEQLFFAGVLPYYAGEMGLDVQVVYLVNHNDTHERPHEQLNGLWTVGVRSYPVISEFPDLYSESREEAIAAFSANGVEYGDFVKYVTDNIRRFKPLVVVSHDLNGEYGHGTHILCASAICDALEISDDSSVYPDSASLYGVWKPEKVYLHLYPGAQITMDFDRPLEHFGGKSAFQVTQEGFACHKSQHWTWFNDWMYGSGENAITRADQITSYSPLYYGLYFTSVGPDVIGGDFFENVQVYKERETESSDTTYPPDTAPATERDVPSAENLTMPDPSHENEQADHENRSMQTALAAILIITVAAVCILLAVNKPRHKRSRRTQR